MLLLRLDKIEYIDDICKNGRIYMRLLRKFKEAMYPSNHELISDKNEGVGTDQIQYYLNANLDSDNITNAKWEYIGTGKDFYYSSVYPCVFCMIGIHPKSLYECSKNEFHWLLTWSTINGMLNSRCVNDCSILMIWNFEEIVSKWVDEINRRKIKGMYGFVAYDNHSFVPNSKIHTEQNALESCFHKDIYYKEQSEFRFAVSARDDKDISDIEIGALAQESYRVMPIKPGKDLHIKIIDNKITDKNQEKHVYIYCARWV